MSRNPLFSGACAPALGAVMSDHPGSVTSYVTSALAYVASHICVTDILSEFMLWGSALLLLARLCVDIPRAWHAMKKWRHRG